MEKIKQLSLKAKLVILVGLMTVVILAASVYLIGNFSIINQQAKDIEYREMLILNKAHELKLSVVQVQQWLTDISATRGLDGLNDGFDEAENQAQVFHKLVKELKELDKENSGVYASLEPTFEDYYRVGKEMATAYIEEGPSGGNSMMEDFDGVVVKISAQVDNVLQQATDRTEKILMSQDTLIGNSLRSLWVAAGVVLVFLFIFFYSMSRALAGLPVLVEELKRVAHGDLTSTISVDRNDEIGDLSKSLQTMRSNLLEIVTKILHSTKSLATAASEMSTISSQTSESVAQQRSETEQVAAAMNQMTATVHNVSSNITDTAASAESAHNETVNGNQIVKQAVSKIQQLSSQINNASETIHELENSSQHITSVLDVIKGVAEQTNLLALNAAIEAARAGEQGRGFAVVADEVRTLASRTQESTEEIHQMIDQLLSGTQTAVDAMNKSREDAKAAVDQASTAKTSLDSISAAVSKIHDMSTEIAASSEEQSTTTEEINRNIVGISDMTDKTSRAAKKVSDASENLSQIAADLDMMCGDFKIN